MNMEMIFFIHHRDSKNFFITISAPGLACIISIMVPAGVCQCCMRSFCKSAFLHSPTITSHRLISPCRTAIFPSCSSLLVSIIVTPLEVMSSRRSCIRTFFSSNVSVATAILRFALAAGHQRACTEGIPFGAFVMTPA